MPGNKAQTGVTEPWRRLPGTGAPPGSGPVPRPHLEGPGRSRAAAPRCHVPPRCHRSRGRPGPPVSFTGGRPGSPQPRRSRAPLAPRSPREPRRAREPPRDGGRRCGVGRAQPGRTDRARPRIRSRRQPTHPRPGRAGAGGLCPLPARPATTLRCFPRREVGAGGAGRGLGGLGAGLPAALTYVGVAEGLLRVDGRAAAGVGRTGPAEQQHRQPGQQAGQRGGHGAGLRPPGPDPAPTAGPGRAAAGNLGPAGAGALRPPLRCLHGAVRFLPAALGLAL